MRAACNPLVSFPSFSASMDGHFFYKTVVSCLRASMGSIAPNNERRAQVGGDAFAVLKIIVACRAKMRMVIERMDQDHHRWHGYGTTDDS